MDEPGEAKRHLGDHQRLILKPRHISVCLFLNVTLYYLFPLRLIFTFPPTGAACSLLSVS